MERASAIGGFEVVDRMAEVLRRAGLRPTRQRVQLSGILFAKGHRHLSADDLQAEAEAAGIHVSLATIYNALHKFTKAGLLRAVAVDRGRAYFDTNVSNHHHFFIEGEGQLVDLVGDVEIKYLPKPPEGMEIISIELVVRVCRRAELS